MLKNHGERTSIRRYVNKMEMFKNKNKNILKKNVILNF